MTERRPNSFIRVPCDVSCVGRRIMFTRKHRYPLMFLDATRISRSTRLMLRRGSEPFRIPLSFGAQAIRPLVLSLLQGERRWFLPCTVVGTYPVCTMKDIPEDLENTEILCDAVVCQRRPKNEQKGVRILCWTICTTKATYYLGSFINSLRLVLPNSTIVPKTPLGHFP